MATSESEPGTTQVVAAKPADPILGRRFNDRYEILEPLGRGGMATVYLAHDHELKRRVVVKMPRVDLVKELGRDMLLRFIAEMDAQAELQHPHIVGILGRGQIEALGLELPFIVADFKDGGDLEKRLREGKQDLVEVMSWLAPIASALDFSHQSWVHRDVKPDNILYDRQGFVYLSDFGIAKAINRGSATTPMDGGPPATAFGHVIGTPGYIPPEAASRDYTPAYDQFALAVVVVQALSGQRPTAAAGGSPDKAELQRAVPSAYRSVVGRALSARPEDRFPSCAAFAAALQKAEQDRRRIPRLAASGLAVIAVGAAVWWAMPDPATPPIPIPVPVPVPDPNGGGMEPPSPVVVDDEPRTFELGSTAQEQELALSLCRDRLGDTCRPEWFESERPRTVELPPYALDPHEVTKAEFGRFIGTEPTHAEEMGSYNVFDLIALRDPGLNWRAPGWSPSLGDQPVVHVTVEEAQRYCESDGGRLPTEDEWEAAARGQERRIFPWGDGWLGGRARWFGNDEVKNPARVAQFAPTAGGLYDLAGNVWEWTSSRDEAGKAIAKGGSFADSNPALLRGAAQQTVPEESYTAIDIGFRCARSLDAWPDEAEADAPGA